MIQFSQDHHDIREMVAAFAENELAPRAMATDEEAKFPADTVAELGNLGLLGAVVPEQYGGSAGDLLMATVIIEELATGCAATALAVATHLVQATLVILEHGSDEQKSNYLPRLASGELLATVAISEPTVDDDGLALVATEREDGWGLHGTRALVPSAASAGLYIVRARAGDSTEVFLLDGGAEAEGISVDSGDGTLGVRGAGLDDVQFRGCRVSEGARLVGAGGGAAAGARLQQLGCIASAAVAVGVGRGACRYATGYARERHAFGGPISRFEALRNQIATSTTGIEAAMMLVYRAACTSATSTDVHHAAMAKLSACDAAYYATKSAVQILGGNGFSREYPVERMFRDVKTLEVVESGPAQHRALIARQVIGSL